MVGIEYNALNRVNRSGDTMTGSLTVPYLNVTGDVDIDGNIVVNGSSTISVNETVTGSLVVNGNMIVSGANGRLQVHSSTGSNILFASGGGVGFGTNAPTAILHVRSSAVNTAFAKFDSSTSDQMFEIVEKTAGDSLIRQRNVDNTITNVFDTAGNSYINGGNLGLGTTSPNAQLTLSGDDLPLHIHGTGSIDLLFVSGNGAIGMGTDTPTNKLDIQGGVNTHITFEVGSSTSGYTLYNSVDNTGAKIGHNSASRDIEFQTAGSSRLTITNIGRVGIGTVAPAAQFEVSGSSPVSFIVQGSGAANVIFVSGNGAIGLGTSSPSRVLEVQNQGVAQSQLGLRSQKVALEIGDIIGGIDFISDDNNIPIPGSRVASIEAHPTETHTTSKLSTNLTFSVTSGLTFSEAMRIDHLGNVGIGTTTTNAKLTLSGEGIPLQIHAVDLANSIFVSGNGAIGLGTNNPVATLELRRTGNLGFRLDNSSTGSSFIFIDRQTGAGTVSVIFSDGGIGQWSMGAVSGTGKAVNVFSINDDINSVARFVLSSGTSTQGQVGINLTSPSARLHISGIVDNTSLRIDASGATSAFRVISGGYIAMSEPNPGLARLDIMLSGGTNADILALHNPDQTNNNSSRITFWSKDTLGNRTSFSNITSKFIDHTDGRETGELQLQTTSSGVTNQKMVVTGPGNVGIGLTSPAVKFHISGLDSSGVQFDSPDFPVISKADTGSFMPIRINGSQFFIPLYA